MKNHHTPSIRLMPGGFSFSDSSESKFVNVAPGADYERRLEDAILDLNINVGDDDMECIVETSRFSLSPSTCDDAEAEKMYGLSLRNAEKEEKLLHEMCHDGEVRVSFGTNLELYNFLVRTFQYINFHHPIVGILDDEATKLHRGDNWMTVSVSQGSLVLVAYKNKKLQLANCLETMVTQNRAYHVLNTWTMLGLDVLADTLYIIGEEKGVERLKAEVSKFIKLCV